MKRYICIAKVNTNKFVKYRLNNLLSFTSFLDKQYPKWRWFNVYEKETKKQLASFTTKNRPDKAFLN